MNSAVFVLIAATVAVQFIDVHGGAHKYILMHELLTFNPLTAVRSYGSFKSLNFLFV